MNDFKYFTYEEYNNLMNMMLYNVWKNTFINKEDLKQNLFIFIMKLENKIKEKDNILNIQGYIVHCLKQKVRLVTKEFFKKIIEKSNINIESLEDNITSDNSIEDYIINKVYIESLFDYYDIPKEEQKLLLFERDNGFRNERYLANRKLKRIMFKNGTQKWRV